jgi:hypothetical protein
MSLSIMTKGIMTISKITPSKMTCCIMTFSIMTRSIIKIKCDNRYNDTQHHDMILCVVLSDVYAERNL